VFLRRPQEMRNPLGDRSHKGVWYAPSPEMQFLRVQLLCTSVQLKSFTWMDVLEICGKIMAKSKKGRTPWAKHRRKNNGQTLKNYFKTTVRGDNVQATEKVSKITMLPLLITI